MNTTLPLASAASNGAGQPTAAIPTASHTAAPTEFLMLLGQIVGQPAQQAMTPLVATTGGLALADAEPESSLDPDAASALGLLPVSLPIFAAESRFAGPPMSGAPEAIAGSQLLGVRAGLAGVDVQMLTDMIESEQAMTREGGDVLDAFHLPATNAESLSSPKATITGEFLSRTVHAPVGSSQWADEIGSRLTLMTEQGKSAASLRLAPEHLGPLEIRISIKDDQASVWFGAAHADTRAAIENALPRLRELFEAQGMSLADAGVFHEAPREQPHAGSAPTLSSDAETVPTDDSAPGIRMSIGLLDAYA